MNKKVADARPHDLVPWITKHVRWQVVGDLPGKTACVSLHDTGYLIRWDQDFVRKSTPAELEAVWLHEAAHIVRGDVFVDMKAEPHPEQYYTAMEYCINDPILKLGHALPEGGITGKVLAEQVGEEPPEAWRGAIAVRDWLVEHQEEDEKGGGEGGEGEDERDIIFSPDASDAARQAHIKAVLNAPRIEGVAGTDLLKPRHTTKPATLDITPVAEVAARLATRAQEGRTKIWGGSWARESKIYPTLKGYHTMPRGDVVVAFDASGSMSAWVPTYWALVEELKAVIDVETWVWADTAAPWDMDEQPDVGGGTQLAPLLDAFVDRDPLIVVFTDGGITDLELARRDARIVWALTPNGQAPFEGLEVVEIGKL